jgi:hypothetical protein
VAARPVDLQILRPGQPNQAFEPTAVKFFEGATGIVNESGSKVFPYKSDKPQRHPWSSTPSASSQPICRERSVGLAAWSRTLNGPRPSGAHRCANRLRRSR